jgi:hypothetical protein
MTVVAALLTACGTTSVSNTVQDDDAKTALATRLDEIEEAVATWRDAGSIRDAHRSAETAANLIVGPNGPNYGDRNGDGVIQGENDAGVLQGAGGTPEGLADPLASNQCVVDNVLGGEWEDPAGRWEIMLETIDRWAPGNNTMPTLPSHPMRVVGWATFTLASDSLDEAHEYAGHAKLHVDISLRALDC